MPFDIRKKKFNVCADMRVARNPITVFATGNKSIKETEGCENEMKPLNDTVTA
jgi:hypothetical protein